MEENLWILFLILPFTLFFVYLGSTLLFKHYYISAILLAIASYFGYIGTLAVSAELSFSLFYIFSFLLMFVAIIKIISLQNFTVIKIGLEFEWLLFFALIFFSLLYSPNRTDGFFYALRVVASVSLIYMLVNVLDQYRQIYYVILIIILFSIVLAFISISQGFKTENMAVNILTQGVKLYRRSAGTVADPNIFATHFFIPIMVLSSVIFEDRIQKKYRLLSSLILPVLILGVAATFSRSAWVSIFVGLLLLTLMRRKYYLILIGSIVVVFSFFLIPDLNIVFQGIINRVTNIFLGIQDDSSRLRIMLAFAAIQMFTDTYAIGVGFRGFPVVVTDYYDRQELIHVLEPHNLFYTLVAELGLLGILLYLWILLQIGIRSYTNYKYDSDPFRSALNLSLFLAFICYLIFYQFYGGGLVDNNFWILTGIIFSIAHLQTKS